MNVLIMVSNDVKTVSSYYPAWSQSVISDINERVICQIRELSDQFLNYKTWSSVSNSSFVFDYYFWLVLVEGNSGFTL